MTIKSNRNIKEGEGECPTKHAHELLFFEILTCMLTFTMHRHVTHSYSSSELPTANLGDIFFTILDNEENVKFCFQIMIYCL